MDKRVWTFRIAGAIVTLLGGYVLVKGYEYTFLIAVATVLVIIGISLWMMAKPESYNAISLDTVMMIGLGQPKKIEDFYEAYKNVETPLGSAWLGKFYTMRQTAMVFGPDANGEYLYFWVTKSGKIGYLGYSDLENFIKKQLTKPLIPGKEKTGEGFDIFLFQKEMKDNLNYFIKTGTVLSFSKAQYPKREKQQ